MGVSWWAFGEVFPIRAFEVLDNIRAPYIGTRFGRTPSSVHMLLKFRMAEQTSNPGMESLITKDLTRLVGSRSRKIVVDALMPFVSCCEKRCVAWLFVNTITVGASRRVDGCLLLQVGFVILWEV